MKTEDLKIERRTIIADKQRNLELRQAQTPLQAVIALATMQRRPRPILNTVPTSRHIKLIGQIRRSETYDPVAEALQYVRAGVDALSFYTDHTLYAHDLDDMLMIATAVKNTPIIYQNYILNDYHVVEARAADASALVLHSSVLDTNMIRKTVSVTQRWKMTALVQVNDEAQLHEANILSPHAIAFGNTEDPNGELALSLLEQHRSHVDFNIRVLPVSRFHTLDEVEFALKHDVHAVIVGRQILADARKTEQLRQLLERD